MSSILKLARIGSSIIGRTKPFKITVLARMPAIANSYNFNGCSYRFKSSSSEPKHDPPKDTTTSGDTHKKPDNIEYMVNFKQYDVKKIFKEFYSVYGPLFIVCHIGVSLISLGWFCTLSWLIVDPTKIIPDFLTPYMTSLVLSGTGVGGKFFVAYAIHKVILPIRLGTAIWITRRLATRVEFFRKRIAKIKTQN